MPDIKKIKKKLARKFSPHILREILRFLNLYIKITGKGIDKTETGAMEELTKCVIEHYYHAYRDGAIWTTLFVPSEIIFAMGLHSFSVEVMAALFAKFGRGAQGLAEADVTAIPTDVCSFHRSALGLASSGVYPPPKLLVGTSTICDSNVKTIKICESITGKKSIIIDVPYDFNDSAIKYLAGQLINFTKSLEEVSGRKMKKESLAKAIELSNQAREKMLKISQARKSPLSPLEGHDALGFMMPSHLLIGSKYAVSFYTKLLEDIEEGIAFNEKNGTKKEKEIRLLWLELKPYFKADIFDKMKNAQNAKIVFEEINHVYWDKLDPENPYESLARKLISNHNNGPLDNRLNVIKTLAKDYNVDGIIAYSTWGCRRNNAAIPTIKKDVNIEGYSLLSLDGDCVDDGNYMSGQVATRIEGFLEMLAARK